MEVGQCPAGDRVISVPVFPLRDVVLFPGTELSLRISETRYVEMLRECMRPGRELGILLARDEASESRLTAPALSVVGLGEVVDAEERERGVWSLVVRGIGRGRIVGRDAPRRPFTIVECEPLQDEHDGACLEEEERFLRDVAMRLVDIVPDVREPIVRLMERVEGSSLADQLACRLIPDAIARQSVLAELDARRRLHLVTTEIAAVLLRAIPKACPRGAAN